MFFKYVLQEIKEKQTTELILDWRTAVHLYFIHKEPKEVKNKIIFLSIRKKYHHGSMSTIRWTPRQSRLADALFMNNQEIANILDDVMESGVHRHPDSFSTATSDLCKPLVLTSLAVCVSSSGLGPFFDQQF